MHHGVIFSFGSAEVCSPAIFETCFTFDKDTWIASTDYYYVHPPGGWIYYFCFFRRPMSGVRRHAWFPLI